MKVIEVNIELVESLSAQERNRFWDAFVSNAIEANKLQYGGLENGFIESDGNFEITDSHKQIVDSWLNGRKEIKNFDLQLITSNT